MKADDVNRLIKQAEQPLVKTYAGGKPNYTTQEVPCKTHPDAPHGFDRNASHSADRYVCECEGWEPVDTVNMSQDRVDETAKGEHEPFIYIREDTEMPFGGYEHCGQHDAGAFPVYTAPPKREWVGLTVNEVLELLLSSKWKAEKTLLFVQRIEAKLKEKNSP